MAHTTTARPSPEAALRAHADPEPVGLELLGVGLWLLSLLLAGALITLAPAGADGALQNVTGSLGRGVAGALTGAMGLGAWMLPVFGIIWGLDCLRGRRPRRWSRRGLLLPLLMALTAVGAALLMGRGTLPGLERSGPGGYFGLAMGTALYETVGKAAGLVVLVGWLAVLRLMTDVEPRQVGTRLLGVLGRLRGPREAWDEEAGEEKDEYESEYDEEPEDEEEEDEEEGYEVLEEDGYEEEEDEEEAPAPKPKRKRKKRRKTKVAPGEYIIPPLDLLIPGERTDPETVREEVESNAYALEETLASFGVEARVVSSLRGPVITFYEIKVPSGIRLSRVTALSDDIAIALKAPSIRIVAPIPGRSTVGIEVPNLVREPVVMRDILEQTQGTLDRKSVPILLGRNTAGKPLVEDLCSMPHALIAGATGSGKSVCINAILLSIIYTRSPEEVKLILIDPKQVELSLYEGIPHLLTPVVTDMRRAAKILEWAVDRMEDRYAQLLACGVRNIAGFNALPADRRAAARERSGMTEEDLPEHMPHLIIVVDELADVILTNGKEVEIAITRLAQKSRAVGIHIILATQRPSTNVITGLIKANMPTRVSFVVSSKIDSRVVLDANGADRLLGMGDMLLMHPRSLHLQRAQGTLVVDSEVRAVVEFLKEQYPETACEDILKLAPGVMKDPMSEDDLYEDAVRAVLSSGLGSASMLQRRLGVGYTRASRLIDMMCDRGLVGPHVGSKAREVFLDLDAWEAQKAEAGATSEIPPYDPDEPVDESWE